MTSSPSQVALVDKRKQWLAALSSKDRNSVINQLTSMAWDAASFRVVNEARRLAPQAPGGGVQLSRLVHSLLDRCFFSAQMAAIRRLTDTGSLEGRLGVYSLTPLFDDMSDHRFLLTRQAIFDAEGLAYDYEPIREKHWQYVFETLGAHAGADSDPSNLDWQSPERRHEHIDRLAGARPDNRSPQDTINNAVFVNLRDKVRRASEEVTQYVNKFIAHAATRRSRELVSADEATITLEHLWEAHRELCQVAGFVAIYVLGHYCAPFLAVPQFDQLKYIEKPMVKHSQVSKLREVWRQFGNDAGTWSNWGLDEYEGEFRKSGT